MALHPLDWDGLPPSCCRRAALTIGNFDGVHLGHAALVGETRRLATELGTRTVVLTFDPHPLQLLRPQSFKPLLTTPEDRSRLLHECGADEVVFLKTTPELLALPAEEFFHKVLHEGLQIRGLVEGENFHFGRGRTGDVALLRTLCRDADVRTSFLSPVAVQGESVSSSKVRAVLERGDVVGARRLLGRPHRLHGRVVTGMRRGRTLGFPTANLSPLTTFPPAEGVYAVRVPLEGSHWPGAANIGPNPTFGEDQRKVEVHLIGFEGDLVGRDLAVDFIARLRDTRPFANPDELVRQLRLDIDAAVKEVGSCPTN